MVAEQEIQKTLNGNSGVKAPVLRPNGEGLYSLIPLTQGKFAIVDDENYEWLNQWKWYAHRDKNTYYAVRHIKGTKTIQMHRQILGLTKGDGKYTDHINHNGLDNRQCNIRICTNAQNHQNQKKKTRTRTSQYKGISWQKGINKWRARIFYNKKNIHLGYFANDMKAAEVYDTKARALFGEFALTNF